MGKGAGMAAGAHGISPPALVEEDALVGGPSLNHSASLMSLLSILRSLQAM